MLIKRLMLTAMLATVSSTVLCTINQDMVGELSVQFGPQNNAITMAALNAVLQECRQVTDWNNIQQLPLSSILRAQLSNNTTSAQLGNNEAFKALFPVNSDEIAQAFKDLVAADSTQLSRNEAINRIEGLRHAPVVVEAVAAPIAVGSPEEIAWVSNQLSQFGVPLTGNLAIDVNLVDPRDNATVLQKAASQGMPGVVDYLLAVGADKNARMPDGKAALDLIEGRGKATGEPWYETVRSSLNRIDS